MFQYNYKAAIQLRYKYYNECQFTGKPMPPPTMDGHFNSTDDNITAEELACMKDAIDKVMKENSLEHEWEQYRMELTVALAALDQCNETEDPEEAQE